MAACSERPRGVRCGPRGRTHPGGARLRWPRALGRRSRSRSPVDARHSPRQQWRGGGARARPESRIGVAVFCAPCPLLAPAATSPLDQVSLPSRGARPPPPCACPRPPWVRFRSGAGGSILTPHGGLAAPPRWLPTRPFLPTRFSMRHAHPPRPASPTPTPPLYPAVSTSLPWLRLRRRRRRGELLRSR